MRFSLFSKRHGALRRLILFFLASTTTLLSVALALGIYFTSTLPPIPDDLSRRVFSSTKIFDRTGTVLLYEIGLRQDIVPLAEISPAMQRAIVASEDAEFYQHPGISIRGIARSLLYNIRSQELAYGGSTITQQLARNLFLTRERTIQRKIREALLALAIERKFSKDKILELYLNTTYFGEGNYGVEAAAKYYFNKSAKELSVIEAATLTSILKAPALRSPLKDPEGTVERRNSVLQRMRALAFLSDAEYSEARASEIHLDINPYRILAPHFSLMVLDEVQKKFPDLDLSKAGLRVISTLDYSLQEQAERFVYEGAERNERLYGGKNAALVALDPKTGEVISLVGSKDFFDIGVDGQVNVPLQLRQPGSSFKPIVYSLLFDRGYPDTTVLFDVPTNFGTESEPYTPQNFNQKFRGPITVRQSLAQSINLTSVKVAYLVSIPEILSRMADWEFGTVPEAKNVGLSIGLGAAEVRPLELARAYAVFANEGALPNVSVIRSISGSEENELFLHEPDLRTVLATETARMITDILSDDAARAPLFGSGGPLTIPGHSVAVKTGTSQDFRDAWSIGYTPDIVIAVWAGNNDGTPMIVGGAGILAAVPIWNNAMTAYLSDKPDVSFTKPVPKTSDKPMLNGAYIADIGGGRQAHSILFYVNPADPLGPQPENPNTDPQFVKWEVPVLEWIASHPEVLLTPSIATP